MGIQNRRNHIRLEISEKMLFFEESEGTLNNGQGWEGTFQAGEITSAHQVSEKALYLGQIKKSILTVKQF